MKKIGNLFKGLQTLIFNHLQSFELKPIFLTWLGLVCFSGLQAQYTDCINALPICDNASLNYSSSGAGMDDFENTSNDNGCLLFGEHQSVWLVIKISQLSAPGAELGFTLTPNNTTNVDDFDFAVYGPLSNCDNLGSPIRCSYANATLDNCGFCPQTGLGMGATDPVEGATGNGFVANLTTYPSEVYYILVDNFTASNTGFSLEWTGDAVLDCNLNCFANPGTYSIAANTGNESMSFPLGNSNPDQYVLCHNDGIVFQTDENYILPDPAGQEDATMLWALYNAVPPAMPSPNDAAFTGVLVDADFINEINTNGLQSTLPSGLNLTNNTLWVVPVTADDGDTNGNPNGTLGIDTDGDGCYVYGEPFAITYLDEIEVIATNNCTETEIKITGGMPALFGGSYTISNLSPASANITNNSPVYQETFSLRNLNYGDSYSFDITDNNGCTSSFSGVFEYAGPYPEVEATPNFSVCPLESVQLVAWTNDFGQDINYIWTGPGGFYSEEQNPVISPAIEGTFSVVVEVDGCPSNPTSVEVEVRDAPSIDPIEAQLICANSFDLSSINLTGSNLIGASFNYYADDNGAPGAPVNAEVVTSGTYWIEAIPADNSFTCNGLQPVEIVLGNVLVSINSIQSVSCQGLADATINTNTSGGQAPFSYVWTGTDANTADVSGLEAGLYSLTVTDAIGCESSLEVLIEEPDPISFQMIDLQDPSCADLDDGSISIAVEGGTMPYNLTWSNGATDMINSNLAAGDYFFTITDANNCTLNNTEAISLTSPTDLSISVSTTDSECSTEAGSITINASGGTGDYTYSWSHDPNINTNTADNLGAGNYTVSVNDQLGCTAVETVSISNSGGPIITVDSISAETCYQNNGAASLTVSGGTGQVFLSWAHNPNLFEPTLQNIGAGTYTLYATDEVGCIASMTIEIPGSIAPEISLGMIEHASCDEASNGAVQLAISGGLAPYTFIWSHDPDNSSDSADNLPPGNHAVAVIDANNCFSSFGFTIEALNLQSLEIDNINPASCNEADGSLTVILTNATEPIEYAWVHNPNLTGPAATNLSAGHYTVLATDANGCTQKLEIDLPHVGGPNLTSLTTNTSGCTISDGTMNIMAEGGYPPYSFSWSHDNTLNAPTATNLPVGFYTVTVTDANGCSNVIFDEIIYPTDFWADVTVIDSGICEIPTGEIHVHAQGGVPPYSYEWSPPVSTDSFALDLGPGTYYITVTDQAGCAIVVSGEITDEGAIELGPDYELVSIKDENCGQGNGEITIHVEDGIDLYWEGYPEFGNATHIDSLSAGEYSVIIPALRVCTDLGGISLGNIPPPVIQVDSLQDLTCSKGTFASVSATGGEGEYSFTWSHDNTLTTSAVADLDPGDYAVTVTDAFGCSDSTSFTIGERFPPVLQLATLEHTECNENNGQIVVLATGGSGELTYHWSHNDLLNSDTARFLNAGIYNLTLTDEEGCSVDTTFEVLGSNAPEIELTEQLDATCNENNGTAIVDVTGGLEPYFYTWSHNDALNSNEAVALSAGAYHVIVRDSNNCVDSLYFDIIDSDGPSLSIAAVTTDSCEAGNGSISVTASGGTGEITLDWTHDPANHTTSADSLTTGYYSVIATDETGCKAIETIFLETTPVPELYLLDMTEIACSDSNGSILILINDSTANVTYTWAHDTSNDSPLAENLEIGNYSVTVSNAEGCSTSANYGVPGTTAPEINIADLQPVNCNQALGQVEVSINQGTPPYDYQWSHNDSLNSPIAENLSGGMLELYSLSVVDSNECQDSIRFNLPAYNRPQAALDSLAGSICDNPSGAALLKPIPYALFRINCGFESDSLILDHYGNNYEQDSLYFSGGAPDFLDRQIANSETAILFQHRRVDSTDFDYQFPVLNGTYQVRLGFAEISTHYDNLQSDNLFDVNLEGELVLDDFNVFATYGTNIAGWQEFTVDITDGSIDLSFITESGFAQISTIEIIPLPQAPLSYTWLHDNTNTSAQVQSLEPGEYEVLLTDEWGCEHTISVNIGDIELASELDFSTTLDTCRTGTGSLTLQANTDPSIRRINCGGPEYVSDTGAIFEADEAEDNGAIATSNNPIAGTDDEALYQSVKQDAYYEIPLPNGQYLLKLHYVAWESTPADSANIFNVEVEGKVISPNFEILNATGTQTALVTQHIITTTDEMLHLNFKGVTGYAAIAAIEILPNLDEPISYSYNWSHDPNEESNQLSDLIAGDYNVTIYDNYGCATEEAISVLSTPEVGFEITTDEADCGFSNGAISVVIDPGNLVNNGDFSAGNFGFESDYNFTTGNTGKGRFSITDLASEANSNFAPCEDHTIDGQLFMVVNSRTQPETEVWCQEFEVIPGITYDISAWFTALRDVNPAILQFSINGTYIGQELELSTQTCTWQELSSSWTADTNFVRFCIINHLDLGLGNDFGVDDISFHPQAFPSDFTWEHAPNIQSDSIGNLAPGTYYVSATDNYGCEFRDSAIVENADGTEFVIAHVDRPGCDLFDGKIIISGAPLYRINAGGSAHIGQLTGNLFEADTLFNNGFEDSHGEQVLKTEDDVLFQTMRQGNFNYNLPIEENGDYEVVLYFSEPNDQNRSFDIIIEGETVESNFNIYSEAGFNQALIKRYNIALADDLLTIAFQDNAGTPIISALEVYKAVPENTSFDWAHNVNLNAPTANNLTRGTYNVMITESNSCTKELSWELEFPSDPQISLLGSVEPAACLGVLGNAIVEVEGNGGYVYSWSHNSTLDSPTAENLVTGTYTVSVTDINNCRDTMEIELLDLTIPVITLDSLTNSVCNNDDGNIYITASGGAGSYQYSWLHNDSLNVPFADSLLPGEYTVFVVDKNGCTASQTYPINSNGPLLEIGTVENTFCDSIFGSVMVEEVGNPTGATSYSWSHDPALDSPIAENLASGDYYVIASDESGCVDTLYATVGNIDGPGILDVAVYDPDSCYVNTGSAQLILAEGPEIASYSWSHDPTLTGISATNLAPGTYAVTLTDIYGCSNETDFEIIAPETFQLDLVSSQLATCSETNGAATVQITGGNAPFEYNWSHDSGLNSNQATGLGGGLYTLTVTDASQCIDVIEFPIISIEQPLIIVDSIQPTFCELTIGAVALSVNSNADSVYFQWSHNPALETNEATDLAAGTYTVTVTDNYNCSTETEVLVGSISEQITTQEEVSICDGEEFEYEGLTYSQDTSFCVNFTTLEGCDSMHCITLRTLENNTTFLQAYSCNQNEVGVFSDTLSNFNGCDSVIITTVDLVLADTTELTAYNCDPNQVGVFEQTLSNQWGCDSLVITTVELLQQDTTYLNDVTCEPSEAGVFVDYLTNQYGCDSMIVLTVEALRKDTMYHRYESCDPDLLGTFIDHYTNMVGCDSMVITEYVYPQYELRAEAPEDMKVDLGDSIQLNIQANFDPVYIEWTPADGLSCDDCMDPMVYITQDQEYSVYLLDENGCDVTVDFRVEVNPFCDIYVPNAFSPNGDGINDAFTVFSAECVAEVERLLIFDRWGELVFEATEFMPNDLNFGWDGVFRGQTMNPAVFAWFTVVRLVNGEKVLLEGDLTLVR